MSAQSEAQFIAALEAYRLAYAADAGASPMRLTSAARAHVDAYRPGALGELIEAFRVANSSPSMDPAVVQEMAQELSALRSATEIAAGNLPYRNPVVTTE